MRAIVVIATLASVGHAQAQCACNSLPLVVAIGDSRTADRADGQTPWPSLVTEANMRNLAVGGAVWTGCVAQPPFGTSRLVIQCGVNDIIGGANGATLWATAQAYLVGRSVLGLRTWVMSMPGFKGYDSAAAKLTQRNAFNTAFATYCAAPGAGVSCVDIATLMDDPGDTDALLAAYSLDGLHYTTAGNAVVASAFEAAHP